MPQNTRPQGGSLFYQAPKPQKSDIRKKRWKIGSIILKAVKRACMVIGAVVLFSAFLTFITLTTAVKSTTPALPKEMVLVLKLEQGIVEKPDEASFADLFPVSRPTIRQVTETLDRAAKDERIKALIVNLKSGGVSLNHIQEFRAAVKRFRESGKKAYFYSSSFMDSGSTLGAYYLASSFDEIWMQPVGFLSVANFGIEVPLARGFLEKVGITPQFLQREKYKSAMESFTERELTPESRESLNETLSAFSGFIGSDIMQDRQVSKEALEAAMSKGVLDGEMALNIGLLDRLDYGDVLVSGIRDEVKGDPDDETLKLVSFRQYANAAQSTKTDTGNPVISKKPTVALIYVTGTIVASAMNATSAAADDISPAIIEAAEDEDVKAIILRVNSPGGSPRASETIRRAVLRAKEKGKFVAVSMGDLAASGGYWVSTDADVIFANPSTLTGSIGVVMGKFDISALWNNLDVNWAAIDTGESSGLWSVNRPFSESQLAHMNTLIDGTYSAFLSRVAEGRNMSVEDVREVAQGRVWTGEMAAQNGLVDEIGGLHDTLTYIAQREGMISADNLNVVVMPKPKSRVEQILELLGGNTNIVSTFLRLDELLTTLEPVLSKIHQVQNPNAYITYDSDLEFMQQ
ncbi:MAG: signal peptide peptidase SppA [Pseudomonadota bacterium]